MPHDDETQTATAVIVPAPNYPGVRPGLRVLILDGPHEGALFCLQGPTAPLNTRVTVRFHPQDQFARLV